MKAAAAGSQKGGVLIQRPLIGLSFGKHRESLQTDVAEGHEHHKDRCFEHPASLQAMREPQED